MMPKWMEDRYMNIIVMASIQRESNAPMDALRVLNPPVAHTLMAWHTASKKGMPAIRYATRQRRQMPMYTYANMYTVRLGRA